MIIFSVASKYFFPREFCSWQFVPLFLFKLKFILLLACLFFSGRSRDSGHTFFFWCSRRGKGSDTLIHTQFSLSYELWSLKVAELGDGNSRRQTDKRSGLLSPLFFPFGRQHLSHTFIICREEGEEAYLPVCLPGEDFWCCLSGGRKVARLKCRSEEW